MKEVHIFNNVYVILFMIFFLKTCSEYPLELTQQQHMILYKIA